MSVSDTRKIKTIIILSYYYQVYYVQYCEIWIFSRIYKYNFSWRQMYYMGELKITTVLLWKIFASKYVSWAPKSIFSIHYVELTGLGERKILRVWCTPLSFLEIFFSFVQSPSSALSFQIYDHAIGVISILQR